MSGNNFTLNGNNQSGILEINAYKLSNVVLDNINFINGYLKGSSGAAIRSLSNDIEIKNCYFENNTAKNYGGAIYLGWDRGIISNCLFVNNTADSGGAIYIFQVMGSRLKILHLEKIMEIEVDLFIYIQKM